MVQKKSLVAMEEKVQSPPFKKFSFVSAALKKFNMLGVPRVRIFSNFLPIILKLCQMLTYFLGKHLPSQVPNFISLFPQSQSSKEKLRKVKSVKKLKSLLVR